MNYEILEARIEYNPKSEQIKRVTVLVDCTSGTSKTYTDVRAIFATTKPMAGYMNISPWDKLNNELLQKVAASGCETVDRDEIFPKWRAKYKWRDKYK